MKQGDIRYRYSDGLRLRVWYVDDARVTLQVERDGEWHDYCTERKETVEQFTAPEDRWPKE